MFKQMKKKMDSKKGFTLAELLVVIAILAILIAIAIPVFSNMVADSNLRVNQANVRSVRSAGVAYTLTHLHDKDATTTTDMSVGLDEKGGWLAIAKVDNNGDIMDLKVYAKADISAYKNGISTVQTGPISSAGTFYPLSDDVKSPFATVKPASGTDNTYWVQAVITDID